MTKLLAVDLDGTLLRRNGEVDERDAAAIARVQARGIPITIVTGRLFAGTRAFAEQLGIRGPVACADGAQLVRAADGHELAHLGIAGRAAACLHEQLAPLAAATFALYDEGVLYDGRGAAMTRYVRSWTPKLEEVDNLFEHVCWQSRRGISGLVVVGLEADVGDTPAELRTTGLFEVTDFVLRRTPSGETLPATRAMLIHARGATKGTAVERLAEHYGCRADDVTAVGDWLNDVDMFRVAGRSFVMAHAPAAVQAAATDVLEADGESGGGVAETIDALWPEEE